MTEYEPRRDWTTSLASGDALGGAVMRGVAVHWPGTAQDVIGDPGKAAIAERLRHYRSYHLGKEWRDIGYNFAIDQAGRVWMLRSTQWHGNLVGAHCASKANPDANHEYVGVLLLLGDREALSAAMIRAFRDWYHDHFLRGWPNRYDVRGHGQVAGASTSCPGPYARAHMGNLTTPNSTPTPTPEDEEMSVDNVRIGVHSLLKEAAAASTAETDDDAANTPTGRQVRNYLQDIMGPIVTASVKAELDAREAADPS